MASKSKIEWTEATWNPVVGCSVITPGCTNCYAMKEAFRFGHNPKLPQYHGLTKMTRGGAVWTGKLRLAERALEVPLRRKKPTIYFVNSMGDLFHEDTRDAWIDRVFAIMSLCQQHTFQILTKRADRMREYFDQDPRDRINAWAGTFRHWDQITEVDWPLPNVWLGVSAEDQEQANWRIPELLRTPAALRFVSAEPLLAPIDFSCLPFQDGHPKHSWSALDGSASLYGKSLDETEEVTVRLDDFREQKLDLVIAGGESGKRSRPMHPNWVRQIRDDCLAADVPFFFKQWGNWLPSDQACPSHFDGSPVDCLDAWNWEEAIEDGAVIFGQDEVHFLRINKKRHAGRYLDGQIWDQMPEIRRSS